MVAGLSIFLLAVIGGMLFGPLGSLFAVFEAFFLVGVGMYLERMAKERAKADIQKMLKELSEMKPVVPNARTYNDGKTVVTKVEDD